MLRAASDGCMVTGVHAEDQHREQTGTHGTAAWKQPWHREATETRLFLRIASASLSLRAVA